jgi:hypothetical protein
VLCRCNGHRISSCSSISNFLFYPLACQANSGPAIADHFFDDDEDDEWKVIAEYATNHQQAMDAHEIVDDIYIHAENFMHESGTVCSQTTLVNWRTCTSGA